jgi:hypothetical protein
LLAQIGAIQDAGASQEAYQTQVTRPNDEVHDSNEAARAADEDEDDLVEPSSLSTVGSAVSKVADPPRLFVFTLLKPVHY